MGVVGMNVAFRVYGAILVVMSSCVWPRENEDLHKWQYATSGCLVGAGLGKNSRLIRTTSSSAADIGPAVMYCYWLFC